MIECRYNNLKCEKSDFNWYYSYDFGNCFSFNTGINETNRQSIGFKQAKKPGFKNGLYLELFIGQANDSFLLNKDYGAVAFLNMENRKPETAQPIKMRPSTHTDVLIKKIVQKKVFTPNSECKDLFLFDFNRIFYNAIINSTFNYYTQTDCFDVCLQRKILINCNCYDLRFLNYNNTEISCVNQSQIDCSDYEYERFVQSDIQTECSECPLECNSVELDISLSTSEFPSQKYAEYLIKMDKIKSHSNKSHYLLDVNQIKRNVLALNIFYSDLEYTLIAESLQNDIVDAIANIGGTIGIFIGISLLSLAEIFEYLLEVLMVYKYNSFN